MLTGVASNMVAFVGEEMKPANAMEIDQPDSSKRDGHSNVQALEDMHIHQLNCGDTLTHPSNTAGELT